MCQADSVTSPAPVGDNVSKAIEVFVASERRSKFAFLGRYPHKYPLNEILAVYHAEPENIEKVIRRFGLHDLDLSECTWYTFDQLLSKLKDTVPTRNTATSEEEGKVRLDRIKVLHIENGNKEWLSVDDWMKIKFTWDDSFEQKYRDMQLEEQRTWWDTNGKVFRLMDLPLELRQAIYLEVIGHVVVPKLMPHRRWHDDNGVRSNLGNGHRYTNKNRIVGRKLDPDTEPPNHNLFLVSRQVRDEALEHVWKHTTKRFQSYGHIQGGLVCPPEFIRVTPFYAMASLQLDCTADAYFNLIRIQPRFCFRDAGGFVLFDDIRKIPTLKFLDLRFMSPNNPVAVCPWKKLNPKKFLHSCQKAWIDLFLTFALEHLRQCKGKISLSGCVKDSTRKKWEEIFADEHAGVLHDMEERKKLIRAMGYITAPLRCRCTVPCAVIKEDCSEENYFSFQD